MSLLDLLLFVHDRKCMIFRVLEQAYVERGSMGERALTRDHDLSNKKLSYRTETVLQGGSVLARQWVVHVMRRIYV